MVEQVAVFVQRDGQDDGNGREEEIDELSSLVEVLVRDAEDQQHGYHQDGCDQKRVGSDAARSLADAASGYIGQQAQQNSEQG